MRLAFRAAPTPEARRALAELEAAYPHVPAAEADVIVPLGGDGFMLRDPARLPLDGSLPIYGMNLGTIGFLLNVYQKGSAWRSGSRPPPSRSTSYPLRDARPPPLGARSSTALGINEVSVFRETRQAAAVSHPASTACAACRSWSATPGLLDRHPRRQHRLQPLPPLADHPARRQPPGADPDQPLPPPALARRPPALPIPASTSTSSTPASARSAPWPTSPRPATSRASRSGRTATSPAACCSTPSTTSRSAS